MPGSSSRIRPVNQVSPAALDTLRGLAETPGGSDMTENTCSVHGCDGAVKARSWCSTHYQRWWVHGNPLAPLVRQPSVGSCSVGGCDRTARAKGLCSMHYSRWRAHGHTDDPFTHGCVVDGCDRPHAVKSYCMVHYQRWLRLGTTDDPVYRDLCEVDGCDKPEHAGSYCHMHYSRWRKSGTLGELESSRWRSPGLICKIDGCNNLARKRRLCSRHYRHVWIEEHPGIRWRGPWCITVSELALRDGTNCSICGEPVDLALHFPDLMYPSVDHVVPRSKGGEDEPHNCQLAHLRCNMSKSDRV